VKNRRPEQAVQRAVFQHLRIRGKPGVFAFHCPNGGARSPIEAKILKGQGVVAGVPDIIAIKDGTVFGLELKAPGGRLSPAQQACHAALKVAGAVVATAPGIDEALEQLERWNLLRGAMHMSKKGNPKATIETLALGWPKCFSVFKRRRRPLKVGIFEDLFALVEGSISRSVLSNALHITAATSFIFGPWSRAPIGSISMAAQLGRSRRARKPQPGSCWPLWLNVDRSGRARNQPDARPQPIEQLAKPKKLGLADLKAAWLARQKLEAAE
jgi:hypothetical protein